MKNKLYILCFLGILMSCKNNTSKKLENITINRGAYSLIKKYDSKLSDTIYEITSLKEIYSKDSNLCYLIFGLLNDSTGNLKIEDNNPSFLMKNQTIIISKSEITILLNKNYTPSILVFKVDTNKINEKTKWYNLSQITDSLIFDFTIIDKTDFPPLCP